MTRQQKIDHIERNGYKVYICYSNASHGTVTTINGANIKRSASVSEAHKKIFGY